MGQDTLKGKTILIVNTGTEGKYFTIHTLKKLGLKVVCLNREKIPALQEYVDHWIIADLNNHKDSIEAVREFIATHPKVKLDGVVTFWDECVLLVSKLVDQFSFIGIPYHIAEKAKNKFLFRDFCENNGILTPGHMKIKSKKDIPKLEKNLNYPMVIKPVYGSCSIFVMKIRNRQELEEAFDYIQSNPDAGWIVPEWENLELFVEEYIDGDEVDIDILLQHGKIKWFAISDNFNKDRDKFFVDSGQASFSGLPLKDQETLINMAEESLEKLGIQDGCIHYEAKITKKGAFPIEVNLRMGGDYIHSYIKASWHVDLVEYSARIALGDFIKVNKPEVPYKYIIGWDLQPESSGILVELDISDELKNKKYVEKMHFFKEIGDPIMRPPEGYDSLGWITVSGDNLLDAQDNLEEALSLIKYKVVEFNEESSLGKTSRKNSLSAAVIKKDRLLQAAKMEKVRSIPIEDQRKLHIGIATNVMNYKANSYNDTKAVIIDIEKELKKRGYKTTVFDFNNLAKTYADLAKSNVDLMFNVCQGINNNEFLKPQAAAILETLHIPYTGTNSFNLALCRDKIRIKKLLTYHDIPTPKWDYAYTLNDTISEDLKYPLIVKPANADHSMGITNSSVVTNKNQLKKQIEKIIVGLGRPALVEEYVEGEEYTVSILGSSDEDLRVLPLSRAVFKKMPKGYWHIYTEEAKKEKSGAHKKIIVQNPLKNVSKKLESLITEIALDTYKIIQCRDYGRVEIRVDEEGNPYVLELNPNPFLDNYGHLLESAKLIGLDAGDLLEEVIRLTVQRFKKKHSLLS